jgi:hypothetical protein
LGTNFILFSFNAHVRSSLKTADASLLFQMFAPPSRTQKIQNARMIARAMDRLTLEQEYFGGGEIRLQLYKSVAEVYSYPENSSARMSSSAIPAPISILRTLVTMAGGPAM